MRKSLGSKRNEMSEDDIKMITQSFGDFEVMAGGIDCIERIVVYRGKPIVGDVWLEILSLVLLIHQ